MDPVLYAFELGHMKGFCLPKAVCALVHRMKVVYSHSILSQKHITTHMHVILKTCLKMLARHVDCLVRVISHCTNMLFLQAFQLLKNRKFPVITAGIWHPK